MQNRYKLISDGAVILFDVSITAPNLRWEVDTDMNKNVDHFSNSTIGDAGALVEKGFEYEKKGDLDKAIECYRRGSQLGDTAAMHNLGVLYYAGGESYLPNLSEAEKWLELSAEMGYTFSMSMLGYINYFQFSDESLKKSMKWLERASQKKDCDAMLFLAQNFYLSQDYRFSDYYDEKKGISLLKSAAELGDMRAMLILSQYCFCDRDYWLRRYNMVKMQKAQF